MSKILIKPLSPSNKEDQPKNFNRFNNWMNSFKIKVINKK